jgi:hypothetical protein
LAGNEASSLGDAFTDGDQRSVLSRHCGRGGRKPPPSLPADLWWPRPPTQRTAGA